MPAVPAGQSQPQKTTVAQPEALRKISSKESRAYPRLKQGRLPVALLRQKKPAVHLALSQDRSRCLQTTAFRRIPFQTASSLLPAATDMPIRARSKRSIRTEKDGPGRK